MQKKWVYNFKEGCSIDQLDRVVKLGGKGSVLSELFSEIHSPVPTGFTITTEACTYYYNNDGALPQGLDDEVCMAIAYLEKQEERGFGCNKRPLLISIRSGASISMPGMMDSILNLGLNDISVVALAENTKNARFAYDAYRRFLHMYGSIVLLVSDNLFKNIFESHKRTSKLSIDHQLPVDALKSIVEEYKQLILETTGKLPPQNAYEQLWGAIRAIFNSWMNERALNYRKINNIPQNLGTAVNVQTMVFGNMCSRSASGVVFTRNPSHGAKEIFGEFLLNAQGEDVVAGSRNALPIGKHMSIHNRQSIGQSGKYTAQKAQSMEELMPDVFEKLVEHCKKLETHYCDMQDIEFTVQEGKLWILQARSGKRSAEAAIKIAIDMVNEGLITKSDAIMRITPTSLTQMLHPIIDREACYNLDIKVLTIGLAASPGVASGAVVFTSEKAEIMSKTQPVILVRCETSPEDINGINVASGILTARGGMTSHAAVVTRGMGKPCVCGAGDIVLNDTYDVMSINGVQVQSGDIITINGSTGEVILGAVPTSKPTKSPEMQKIISWADESCSMTVRANAETHKDITTALDMGADGVGLCRTEHMFFASDRIVAVRRMILASNEEERNSALAELLPYQRNDFKMIFSLMQNAPVTIRLLDMPLHEFLPHNGEEIDEFCNITGQNIRDIETRLSRLRETNPMLGHRGCRLAITSPRIYQMQVRAIFEAIAELYVDGTLRNGFVQPEIMIPLVVDAQEIKILSSLIKTTAMKVQEELESKCNAAPYFKKAHCNIMHYSATCAEALLTATYSVSHTIRYKIGVMIETPRAALQASEIAALVDFCSFGTNDLTQTTLGISRDDSGTFIQRYLDETIFHDDPFVSLDEVGVGELMKIAVARARTSNPNISLGVCGEHGGNPNSINFFYSLGLNYISCSPYRISIAKLAAAQAEMLRKY